MKAIIIDDEPLARSIVNEFLQDYSAVEVVAECNDGFEGIKAIMQHHPDLLFLDIQMPKINGFEMLEVIENPPLVIFTTAFDEYALKAFETHAVDYLLKPFSKERFDKAMAKVLTDANMGEQKKATEQLLQSEAGTPSQNERIVVKTGGKIKIIPVYQVLYIEAADDYVKIHSADGSFLKNKTMTHYEKILPTKDFVRIHRSYIVNVQEVTRIDAYDKENHIAILRSGIQLPVSKAGYSRIRSILGI
ncbi:MAG: LytR/AlgR family response regulator transcription factor [Candidatus Dadabacteria bacterium]